MKKNKRKKSTGERGYQKATLAISTSLVLILLGLVVMSVLTARNLSSYVKENLSVSLLLNHDMTESQCQQLSKQLKTKRYISEVKYISKDDALKEQQKQMGADPAEFVGNNPFSAEIEIHLVADYANNDSLKWIKKELASDERVSQVTCMDDLIEKVNVSLQKINIILLVLAGVLTFISFTLINNTVRLGVYARRFVIRTMKLVGASWMFIRWPFLRNALFVGFMAAIIACAVLGAGLYFLITNEPDVLTIITQEVMMITAGAIFVFGIIITFFCSYFSVNKYLKMKAADLYKI